MNRGRFDEPCRVEFGRVKPCRVTIFRVKPWRGTCSAELNFCRVEPRATPASMLVPIRLPGSDLLHTVCCGLRNVAVPYSVRGPPVSAGPLPGCLSHRPGKPRTQGRRLNSAKAQLGRLNSAKAQLGKGSTRRLNAAQAQLGKAQLGKAPPGKVQLVMLNSARLNPARLNSAR